MLDKMKESDKDTKEDFLLIVKYFFTHAYKKSTDGQYWIFKKVMRRTLFLLYPELVSSCNIRLNIYFSGGENDPTVRRLTPQELLAKRNEFMGITEPTISHLQQTDVASSNNFVNNRINSPEPIRKGMSPKKMKLCTSKCNQRNSISFNKPCFQRKTPSWILICRINNCHRDASPHMSDSLKRQLIVKLVYSKILEFRILPLPSRKTLRLKAYNQVLISCNQFSVKLRNEYHLIRTLIVWLTLLIPHLTTAVVLSTMVPLPTQKTLVPLPTNLTGTLAIPKATESVFDFDTLADA